MKKILVAFGVIILFAGTAATAGQTTEKKEAVPFIKDPRFVQAVGLL
ncbi:MAG: hypothetical protein MUQ00_10705 [Candidatus Aminicenantes bacterium]|nr:hypothetical protein [Candidatus Aminicenantes bacterium]